MRLEKNIGEMDKKIRIILGLILSLFGFFASGFLGIILLVLSAILLVTAFTGFCGIYKVLGINTCKLKDKKD